MSEKFILLRPSRIWSNGTVSEGTDVLVRGNRIAAIGPDIAAAEAKTVALPGCTLLPGLMDIHSHLFLHPYNETLWDDQVLKEPFAYRVLLASAHARATLENR